VYEIFYTQVWNKAQGAKGIIILISSKILGRTPRYWTK
jgi:hypothetical protein